MLELLTAKIVTFIRKLCIEYSISNNRLNCGDVEMWFNHRMGMGPHRRGGLRMMLVTMLRQAPRNGAELINQIELMSQGWWRPSPGSVYPLLDEMQKEGIIKKREDGKYELTEKADQDFEWPWGMSSKQQRTVEEMVTEMNSYISYLEDMVKSDKSKIAPHIGNLKNIRDRLTALLESKEAAANDL